MKPVRFLPPSEREMLDAAAWYEAQAPNLGHAFLDAVELAEHAIAAHPRQGPVVKGSVRRHLLVRFPYALLYRETREELLVLAVMHLRRHPMYWTRRG
jgi:toxin ParE1/3/4